MKSTAQGNKLHRCRYAGCTKEFGSRTGRRSHEEVEHEGKKHDCDEPGCKKKYRSPSALVSHKRAKHDKIPFRCNYPDCTKKFESRNGRNKHRNRDHTPLANAERPESLLSTPGNGALSRGARWQRDQPRQPRQAAATILNPPAATSSHELLTLTSAPEVEDGDQRQDPRDEPVSQMLSETESGVRPHHQPQQVAENTNHGSTSFILNSPATTASDHSLHPLANIPIDPMLKDPQAPTSPTCIDGMPHPPAKTMPSSIRTRIVEPRYYCGECGKEYQRGDNLRDHAKQHLAPCEGRIYGCNNHDCGKPCFELWKGLKEHVCSSPMPKPYECIQCRKGFRCSASALRHPSLCRFNTAPSRTNTANHDRSTPGDDIVRLASELDHSKEASAMASVPAATDSRSLTTRSGMTLGGEDEEAGSPAPSYPDGIRSPGSRASWPGRYGSSIHVLDELPDHLRNKSPMADPPETGFSDEDDARSCTTLAGEEDRRSLTPAPVSGRPFRRAYKQGFEGNGARTRNTREQRDVSELAVNLEMEHVDQDQGQGANAIFLASDWPQLQPTSSVEPTAQGDGPSQHALMLTHIADFSNSDTMPRRRSPTTTLHSPIATQPHQPIHSRLPQLQAPQKAPQATPSQFVCSGYGQCQRSFTTNGSLTRHMNSIHKKTGVTCDKCGKTCRAPWDLEQHKKNKHGEGGKLPCGQCKRTFSRESLRLQHVKRVHAGA